MKKFIAFIAASAALVVATVACAGTAKADDDKVIAFEQLPVMAQSFIKENFTEKKVSFVKQDRDFVEVSYEVVFADAVRLEFDSDGEWTEIDQRNSQVDSRFIPVPVLEYVSANYPDAYIVKIERDNRGTEIRLTNGLELSFDKNGNLVDIDD